MKTLLLILFICCAAHGVPLCYGAYSGAVEKVEKIYKVNQYRYSLIYKDQYVYEFFPTTMFPFFCIPLDTLKKLPSYNTMYLCGSTIGINLDSPKERRIQIAVLQYTRSGAGQPGVKTYTLYFFKWNPETKDWDTDRTPVSVIFYRQPDGSYWSK